MVEPAREIGANAKVSGVASLSVPSPPLPTPFITETRNHQWPTTDGVVMLTLLQLKNNDCRKSRLAAALLDFTFYERRFAS